MAFGTWNSVSDALLYYEYDESKADCLLLHRLHSQSLTRDPDRLLHMFGKSVEGVYGRIILIKSPDEVIV